MSGALSSHSQHVEKLFQSFRSAWTSPKSDVRDKVKRAVFFHEISFTVYIIAIVAIASTVEFHLNKSSSS